MPSERNEDLAISTENISCVCVSHGTVGSLDVNLFDDQLVSQFEIENHAAAVALHFIHYNFARIHKTLRITPAMAAGISDHVWSYEEIAALIPEPEFKPRG